MAQTSIALTTLQQTIARAINAGKHDRGRLERAAALVALGAVQQIEAATYRVSSQTTHGTTYTVTPDGCDCIDRQRHPLQRCKHDLAVRLLLQAEIDERRDRFPLLSDAEAARLAALKRRIEQAA